MSFSRIDLLPLYNGAARMKSRERWENDDGRDLHEYILGKIREGAGEDFLQWDFENGRLGFLKNYWDLAGIEISGENITFPTGITLKTLTSRIPVFGTAHLLMRVPHRLILHLLDSTI
jgi:hypothetical protein